MLADGTAVAGRPARSETKKRAANAFCLTESDSEADEGFHPARLGADAATPNGLALVAVQVAPSGVAANPSEEWSVFNAKQKCSVRTLMESDPGDRFIVERITLAISTRFLQRSCK